MKKLKKGLSLLLVLAMVFSLASTAFAWETEYKDDDQITQKEAVAVMTGMGIIEGDETTGLFDPAGQFTREAAAKIITYMVIGPDAAETLTTTNTGFSDVAAGKWSAPYIAYAKSQKIIEGYGNGKFGPTDDLSRAAWLKMLLVSLGVDPDKNGLGDDANWDINAQAMAVRTGLVTAKELKLDWNRETAVLYAFNAMKAAQDGTFASQLINDKDNNSNIYVKHYVPVLHKTTDRDELGRPITYWTDNEEDEAAITKDTVVYASSVEEPVASYTKATKLSTVKDDLDADDITWTAVYLNGEEQLTADSTPAVDTEALAEDGEGADATIGEQGTLIEIYATKKPGEYEAVVIPTYVQKIAKADINAKKGTVTLEKTTVAYKTTELAEDDVVSYNVGTKGALNVTKLEGVDGTVTAINATKEYISVDGTATYFGTNGKKTVGNYTVGDVDTFYYDAYGNILYSETVAPASPDGYAFLITSQTKTTTTTGTLFNEAATSGAAKAQIVDLATGEAKTVDLAIGQDEENVWYFLNQAGALDTAITESDEETPVQIDADLDEEKIYAYYVIDEGYVLVELTQDADVVLQQNSAAFSGAKTLNSASKINVVEYEVKRDGSVAATLTTYTGIANLPKTDDKITADTAYGIVDAAKNDNTVTQAYVVVEKAPATPKPVTAVFVGKGEYDKAQKYEFAIGGEIVSYYVSNDNILEWTSGSEIGSVDFDDLAGTVITLSVDAKGNASNLTDATVVEEASVIAVDSTYVKLSNNSVVYLNENVEVYNAKTYAADEIKAGDSIDYVKVGGDGDDKDEIAYVLVTHPAP